MYGATYAGVLVSSVLYGTCETPPPTRLPVLTVFVLFVLGIVVMLFFQCMAALFNPANRGEEGVKWGFVSYTVVTFSFVSIFTAVNALNIWFDDEDGTLHPGRFGYVIPDLMFLLGYWLADGLLVGSLFDAHLPRCLTLAPPALSLLRDLQHEPLGHCHPLSHVPCLYGYVFEFSKTWRLLSGLTSSM